MNMLMTTFALLTLIALVTFGGQQQFLASTILEKINQENLNDNFKQRLVATTIEFDHLVKLNKNSPGVNQKPPSETTGGNHEAKQRLRLDVPPTHHRLDFGNITKEDFKKSKSDTPDLFSYYHTSARLLRSLYASFNFFHELPNVEYIILDSLFYASHSKDYKEYLKSNFQGPITLPHHLTAIPFNDPKVREIFCKILEGGKEGERYYPSLFTYATFARGNKSQKKISIHSVSEQVLTACLNNSEVAKNLIEKRTALYQKHQRTQKSGKVYTDVFLKLQEEEQNIRSVGAPIDKFSFNHECY
ncbi:MAG: hypothetical protein JHC93_02515 [Parachlamydiales bacterium]|nr:hypothetical protein [Parachlamydiales bacterium]